MKKIRWTIRSRKYLTGVGLVEVMVSLLVLSVGLLGMVGLQSRSLQFNQEAYLRSQAVVLAKDMIDRMRANAISASTAGNYLANENQYVAGTCTEESYVDRCEVSTCTASEMAIYDMQQWKFLLNCHLPEARATIVEETAVDGTSSSGLIHVITVWYEGPFSENRERTVEFRGAI